MCIPLKGAADIREGVCTHDYFTPTRLAIHHETIVLMACVVRELNEILFPQLIGFPDPDA
jgi:hypothetical protein